VVDWNRYVTAQAVRDGGYDLRRAPPAVRGWFRSGFEVARRLRPLRVRPAAVTMLGLALAGLVPLLATRGPAGLLGAAAAVLLSSFAGTLAGALDLLAPEPGSLRRAIWQEAAGRLTEAAWLAGFWTAGVPGPLVVACGTLTGLHALVRDRALAAGASRLGAQTIAEHPMRVSVSVAGLALAGLAGLAGPPLESGVLTVAAAAWLLLALLGAGQLTTVVHKTLP
jgi:CDP-diacylglycerol--glycerol-3-phosphate 3-phosphatidyltransferase